MKKGTGVMIYVPSDAPDNYTALTDLQNDESLRNKYWITLDMVEIYQPIPIITFPGGDDKIEVLDFGKMASVTACQILRVKNQHDKSKLLKTKKSV